jgi:hypothetical protein
MEPKRQSANPGAEAGPGAEKRTLQRFTPEERCAAVEAFEKPGLSQKFHAGQWGVYHVTLGFCLKRQRESGGNGLERVSGAPPRRRGMAPLVEPVRAEIVATKQGFRNLGGRRVRDFLLLGVVPAGRVRTGGGLPSAAEISRAPAQGICSDTR